MIDWVSAVIECDNSLNSGCVAKLDAKGEVEWLTLSAIPVRGSYDVSVMVKPVSEARISISGNPAKWLQGHNLFGTNDLKRLMVLFFDELVSVMSTDGLTPTPEQFAKVARGCYHLTRVDVNETWFLPTQADVKAWIRSAGDKMRLQHRGKGVFSGDTLYWGKNSSYWSMKCYSKGDEINSRKSNFPKELRTPQMLEYADRALRLEVTLKSAFLRKSLYCEGERWTEKTGKMLLLEFIKGLEMSNNFTLSDGVIDKMPNKLRLYYKLWLSGEDLRTMMSKPTFYRVRKQLKDFDIDIALVRDKDVQQSKVVPLIRVLEAEPVGIPYWAHKECLVAC